MSQLYDPPAVPTTRPLMAGWAALTVLALAFVFAFGSNVPSADEWEFVPALTGPPPDGLWGWVWDRHNEHRFPLPRAAYLVLFRLTHDFRAGMVVQVAALSGLSLGLMRFAAQLRGRPAWADLFFPLGLLHPGHWENLLMGYQIVFTGYAVLVTAVAVRAVQAADGGPLAPRAVPNAPLAERADHRSGHQTVTGWLAVLLCLFGGSGVIVAVAVAVWVGGRAVADRRLLPLVPVLFVLAYAGWYVAGYERPPHHPPASASPHPVRGVLMVAGEMLAVGFGIGVEAAWPVVAVGVVSLGVVTLVRGRHAGGVWAVAVGVGGVALATGVGRAGFPTGDEMGLWSRYALLTWPALGLAYLVAVRAGDRRVPAVLAVAALLAYPVNATVGVAAGASVRGPLAAVEADARAGRPAEEVAARLADSYHGGQIDRAAVGIPMLREAGIGAFAGHPPTVPRWVWPAAGVAVGVTIWWWRRPTLTRAAERFRPDRDRLAAEVLAAGAATGKPRGLRWVGCDLVGDPLLLWTAARRLKAVAAVVVRFEPEPGSEMEANPMAREPRRGVAQFAYHRGRWRPFGRVLFNLTPEQVADANQTPPPNPLPAAGRG